VANDSGIVGVGVETGAVYHHAGVTIGVKNESASGASSSTDLAIYVVPGRGTAEDYRSFFLVHGTRTPDGELHVTIRAVEVCG
jgi:hypothetical protein